jgi:class 3 adenylate cyclase/tetratricopeptide (TPR) repeat protein
MVTCTSCGRANPVGSRFCNACGAELDAAPLRAAEERKVVTVLFADVTGSTALGERLDAEGLKEVMAAFFEAMREEIEAEGGTVEKFIGDAVMAAFGVPRVHEDDPERALRAALRMRPRLAELNQGLKERHGVKLELRTGINTGEVMAVTDPKPGEALATGDTVNAAARLEQAASPGQVLVAERTAQAARGFHFGRPQALELRGKKEQLQAVELLSEQPVAEGTLSAHIPLVGRASELDLLSTTYRRVVVEERPHLVTLYGEAGVGKSRLVGELLARLESDSPPPSVIRGRCLAYGDGITYWPLAEMLKEKAHVMDTDSAEVARQRVVSAAADVLAGAGAERSHEAAETLAASIGLVAADRGDLSPHEVRAETSLAWRAFFSSLAASVPTVVVVEDLHWADAAMLELLEEVADRATGALLMLCTARPELTAKRPTWGGMRRSFTGLVVEPLGSEESEQLVSSLTGGNGTTAAEREAILARAEGNPFFLEEIVRTLSSGGVGGAQIPDTVQAALAARIDLLPNDEKRALQAAAVVGRVFWPGAVSEVATLEPEAIEEVLDRLQDRDLIVGRLSSTMSRQRELIFRHALVRDVAYESLPRRDRVRMHTDVADWIERTFTGRREEVVELIAHHRMAAYRVDESSDLRVAAFESVAEAAERAYARSGVATSLALAEDALGLSSAPLERARALEILGRASFAAFDGTRAWESFREAADIVKTQTPSDRARIAGICGIAAMIPARSSGVMRTQVPAEEAAPYLELGLECAGDRDSEALARLLASQCFWEFGFGSEAIDDGEDAHRSGERARAIAQRMGRPDLELVALDALTSVNNARGLYGLNDPYDRERLQVTRRVHDPFEISDTYYTAAWSAYEVGRYRDTVALGAEAVERSSDIVPLAQLGLSSLARMPLGEWDQALVDQERVRGLLGARANEPPSFASAGYGVEALIHVARGDDDAAETSLQVMREWDDGPQRPRHWPLASAALALARRGEFSDARRLLDRLLDRGVYRQRELEARAGLVAEEGAWDESARVVEEARRFGENARLLALPLHADRLEGRSFLADGDAARAVALLERAAAGFVELGARWEVALTQLSLGEALLGLGRGEEAARVVELAAEEFERLRVPRELERARTLLVS